MGILCEKHPSTLPAIVPKGRTRRPVLISRGWTAFLASTVALGATHAHAAEPALIDCMLRQGLLEGPIHAGRLFKNIEMRMARGNAQAARELLARYPEFAPNSPLIAAFRKIYRTLARESIYPADQKAFLGAASALDGFASHGIREDR